MLDGFAGLRVWCYSNPQQIERWANRLTKVPASQLSDGDSTSSSSVELWPLSRLKIDTGNPRMPGGQFPTAEEAIAYLLENYDVEELIESIMSSGWLDFEPLIADRVSGTVYEGNRRVAALSLISDAKLRARLRYELPKVKGVAIPKVFSVVPVEGRKAARAYIGFKHINGPYSWDAFAKARYAAAWLEEPGADLDTVSRSLGDRHQTIRRFVDGLRVLEQAESLGFDADDRTSKDFNFSHLYTAVARPNVREFLGIKAVKGLLPKKPVPRPSRENLLRLTSWIYGQTKNREMPIVISQNPDLTQLVEVLGNEEALDELIQTRNLELAFEKVRPPGVRFGKALTSAAAALERADRLSDGYDGGDTYYDLVLNMTKRLRTMRDRMRRLKEGDLADDDL